MSKPTGQCIHGTFYGNANDQHNEFQARLLNEDNSDE